MRRQSVRLAITLAFVVLAAVVTSMYLPVAAEPDVDELVATGRTVFEKSAGGIGCAACHGHFALGDLKTAPNIRSADETRVNNALRGVGAMKFLSLAPEQVKAVQVFLRYLNTLKPVKITIDESGFAPNEVTVSPGQRLQLIVANTLDEACTFTSADAGVRATPIEPDAVADIVWMSPRRNATFKASCAERPEVVFTIVITEASVAGAQR